MNDWVEEKLRKWGEYSATREKGVMGYPSMSPTFRIEASGCNAGYVDPVDAVIIRIDRIIAGIGNDRPELFIVAVCWYVFDEPASKIAGRCRCCRDTVYSRLNMVRHIVRENLELSKNRATFH